MGGTRPRTCSPGGSMTPGSACSPSTTGESAIAVDSRARSSASRTSSPTGRPRSRSPPPCRKSTRSGWRPGVFGPPAARSSRWRHATGGWPPPSRRRPPPTRWPRRATPRSTRHPGQSSAPSRGHRSASRWATQLTAEARHIARCPGGLSVALLLRRETTMPCCPGSRPNSDSASARSVPQRR